MHKQYLSAQAAPDLQVMMLDFNAYFASVEQQLNPALRGTPVGVVPMKAETTSCIAASYEAKAFGVKTGTRVSDARKLCPGIRFVVAKHAKYVKMHLQAVAIVNRFIPVDAVLSIDEMCATLTPRWQSEIAATQLALDIKAALLNELGECMKTSIGFGSNRFLAKTASNLKKPDGLVLLRAAQLPQALYHIELESLNGIGKNIGIRLRGYGIETVEALYQQTRAQLRTVWGGVGGAIFWDKLHGLPVHENATDTQSIGHSHVMPPQERNRASACQVLDRLTQKAAMRLRKSAYLCTGMTVHVGFMKQHQQASSFWTKSTRMLASDDTRTLLSSLHRLLKAWTVTNSPAAPLKVGVLLHGLIPRSQVTGSLFDDVHDVQNNQNLNLALDVLNIRFGKNTLYYATSHEASNSAPMRIAFNRIPDLETEA
jgi:DNA polymerase IV